MALAQFVETGDVGGKLTVEHPPLEVVPGAEIFQAVFLLDIRGGAEGTLPNVALNGPSQVVLDREGFLFDDLYLPAVDFLARDGIGLILVPKGAGGNIVFFPGEMGVVLARS